MGDMHSSTAQSSLTIQGVALFLPDGHAYAVSRSEENVYTGFCMTPQGECVELAHWGQVPSTVLPVLLAATRLIYQPGDMPPVDNGHLWRQVPLESCAHCTHVRGSRPAQNQASAAKDLQR